MKPPLQHDDAVGRQHRHADVVETPQVGIGVDVDDLRGLPVSREQFLGQFAEVAAAAGVQHKRHDWGSIADAGGPGSPETPPPDRSCTPARCRHD